MSNNTTNHNLLICKTCASVWQDGKRIGESGGEKLWQKLQQLAENWDLYHNFPIQAVECMSACNRSCVIAFIAENKITYLFGDLSVENSPEEILQCASKYYHHPDGFLPWAERPESLKNGILAKIPPIKGTKKL
ncbi:DUF1636 domain-containing protein [Anabaena sp. FACHB-1237]|uniref:DUF1636 domain-containing protein n=1 Tax=Anabaena sp. FACHB-1237 TaxID=2692769 RepID=UPI001680F59C|nr:DUF1636 domain-containing protein [Anabaena sp. FACHB-1237]MBD2136782.1 DUF1636 domain-containing protein [Anabaena sp. FACHB-1237]